MLLPTTNIGTKNIILTGASRGIGLAIARFLLRSGHRVLCVARTREPLETLQEEFPGQVEVLVGDLQNFEVSVYIEIVPFFSIYNFCKSGIT